MDMVSFLAVLLTPTTMLVLVALLYIRRLLPLMLTLLQMQLLNLAEPVTERLSFKSTAGAHLTSYMVSRASDSCIIHPLLLCFMILYGRLSQLVNVIICYQP